ncbi:MAG: hypothetical protein RLN69_16690, partial [Woeseiaceae bacterium]
PVTELSENSNSNIAVLGVAFDDANYTAVSIEDASGQRTMFIVAADASIATRHEVEIAGRVYRWSGPYHYRGVE